MDVVEPYVVEPYVVEPYSEYMPICVTAARIVRNATY